MSVEEIAQILSLTLEEVREISEYSNLEQLPGELFSVNKFIITLAYNSSININNKTKCYVGIEDFQVFLYSMKNEEEKARANF
ncbi:MAG: hypothetical protein O4965_20120 [Trichodesmium sp. St19_bin1]|nr:hypothetical protein [Trichodesmium sp. St19_bin1]